MFLQRLMIKPRLSFLLLMFLHLSSTNLFALTCNDLDGAVVISQETTPVYLGFFGSESAPHSINNPVGPYGSSISPSSVRNTVGRYGSNISGYSANSNTAHSPPTIFRDSIFLAFLTTNLLQTPGVSLQEIDNVCGSFYSLVPYEYSPTVNLGGTIKAEDGTDICAMVLASGKFMFSCNPTGVLSLSDLPRENNGTVKRQIYADGFFPKIDTLTDSSYEEVVMTRSGACPSYNTPYDPGVFPDSAGEWIDISGQVLLQDSQTPICAMVLANGQYMFSCDGTGSYALNIPLDANGQFKLQVYADGFAPTIQTFDEFKSTDDVRMARSVECQ